MTTEQVEKIRKFVKESYSINANNIAHEDLVKLARVYLNMMRTETPMVAEHIESDLGL